MHSLANDYPRLLLAEREAPCLSLYQPAHRSFPERQQDPIRFRNLVKSLEQSLQRSYAESELATLIEPFQQLADDPDFWKQGSDGLAVLGAAAFFRVYRLPRSVPELAVVADSFHTKPLMRIVQSADRYQLLGLDRQRARLFEGNRDGIDEVPFADPVPSDVDEALDRDIERERSTRAYGKAGTGSAVRQGTDVRQDSIEADTEAFFRAVDRAVREHHSQPTGLPLLLVALAEHQARFRKLSRNPALLEHGIEADPDALSPEQLRERAWELMQPRYLQRLQGFVDAFGAAQAKGQGTEQLPDAVRAAVAGRVATLLLEADRVLPGRIDLQSGSIVPAELDNPRVDDMLDDLGEQVLRSGGEVIMVPAERMPTKSGLAAIFRF